jgi:hypothetical protein
MVICNRTIQETFQNSAIQNAQKYYKLDIIGKLSYNWFGISEGGKLNLAMLSRISLGVVKHG